MIQIVILVCMAVLGKIYVKYISYCLTLNDTENQFTLSKHVVTSLCSVTSNTVYLYWWGYRRLDFLCSGFGKLWNVPSSQNKVTLSGLTVLLMHLGIWIFVPQCMPLVPIIYCASGSPRLFQGFLWAVKGILLFITCPWLICSCHSRPYFILRGQWDFCFQIV